MCNFCEAAYSPTWSLKAAHASIKHRAAAVITKKMTALGEVLYISKKHHLEHHIKEFFSIRVKGLPLKYVDSYIHPIAILHSYIILRILSIMKVSTEMQLKKQNCRGAIKRQQHSIAQKNHIFIIFKYSNTKKNSQQILNCINHLGKQQFLSEEEGIR